MKRESYNYPPPPVDPANSYSYPNQYRNMAHNAPSESLPGQSIPSIYPHSASVVTQFSYYPPPQPGNDSFQGQSYHPKPLGYEDQSQYWGAYEPAQAPLQPQPHLQHQQNTQPNIIQKIAFMIQAQLPHLRMVMGQSVFSTGRTEQRRRMRSPSSPRSRSRSRDKLRGAEDSGWLCHKCSFPNYEWRNRCRKCNQSREFRRSTSNKLKEWKCQSCQNLNYARRRDCNRCGKPKSFSD